MSVIMKGITATGNIGMKGSVAGSPPALTASQLDTWNTVEIGSALILSSGNLELVWNNGGWYSVARASHYTNSGIRYWEITTLHTSGNGGWVFFPASVVKLGQSTVDGTAPGYNMANAVGAQYQIDSPAYANGTVFACTLDHTAGTLTVQASVGAAVQVIQLGALAGQYLTPTIALYSTDHYIANFGATPFVFTPPAGANQN